MSKVLDYVSAALLFIAIIIIGDEPWTIAVAAVLIFLSLMLGRRRRT